MSKWTPGPWETPYAPYTEPSTGEGPNFSGGDYEVVPPIGESGPVAIANSKANACLIAAAPEMVRLLKLAMPSKYLNAAEKDSWRDERRALLARINGEDE